MQDRDEPTDQVEVGLLDRQFGAGGGRGMGRGGEKVLPMVELVRGSRGLSVASHSLCPLTLQVSLAPPLIPRRPQLRQNC